jgi:hypothetical protein
MGMGEPNPYEPPRSEPTKPRRRGPILWLVLWFVSGTIFCAVALGGDPFTSMMVMGFGAVSFVMGTQFVLVKSKEGDVIQHQSDFHSDK